MAGAREEILGKIAKALENKPHSIPAKPDFEAPIYPAFADDLAVVFAQNFVSTKATFTFCDNHSEFVREISSFVSNRGFKKIFAWENEIIQLLQQAPFAIDTTEKDFLDAEVGITLTEALVARTGSLIISSKQVAGRRLSIFPPVHIAVAFVSQIVPDIKDGLNVVKEKYSSSVLPSLISLTTGASRTADIEKTLVLGAHGPKELILFLIDDTSH